MNKIILIGAGGHAKACIDVIESFGEFSIAGLVEKKQISSNKILGYPLIGTDDDLENLRKEFDNAIITVGQLKTATARKFLFNLIKKLDYHLPTIISPKSYVSKHAKIGEGTIIMHGVVVNANAVIGKNCIINNKALIEHDVFIGDNCHISTGAIINGEVKIGDECFIGSGSITKQTVSIGKNCIVGAGVTIKKNLDPNQLIKN